MCLVAVYCAPCVWSLPLLQPTQPPEGRHPVPQSLPVPRFTQLCSWPPCSKVVRAALGGVSDPAFTPHSQFSIASAMWSVLQASAFNIASPLPCFSTADCHVPEPPGPPGPPPVGRSFPASTSTSHPQSLHQPLVHAPTQLTAMYQSPQGRLGRLVGALLLLLLIPMYGLPFYSYCQMFGLWSSSPRCGVCGGMGGI